MPREDRRHHLFGRCLAVAARDADDERLDAAQGEGGKGEERVPRVGHDHLDDAAGDFPLSLHDHGGRSPRDGVRDELVAVHLRAAKGEEQATMLHLARVGVEAGERLPDLGAADLASARRLEDLEEAEPHVSAVPDSFRASPQRELL